MKCNRVVLLLLLILIAGPSYGQDAARARSFFYEGNARYSEEKYEEAISYYEKALSQGLESGQLYYNLGNAYFKRGSLGKAILYYLRSEKLMPHDADLSANLGYAQSLVKGGIVKSGGNWFARVFLTLAMSLSMDRFTLLNELLYLALIFLLTLTLMNRPLRKHLLYVNITLLVALIVALSLFAARYNREFYETEAVIVARETDCKFEPFIGATTFFTLSEGQSVLVLTSKKDWLKIKRPDGKQGWVKSSELELL